MNNYCTYFQESEKVNGYFKNVLVKKYFYKLFMEQ